MGTSVQGSAPYVRSDRCHFNMARVASTCSCTVLEPLAVMGKHSRGQKQCTLVLAGGVQEARAIRASPPPLLC